jgi:chromosome segregation and condensation protein ScpB
VESTQDKKKMQTSYSITFDFLRHLGVNHQSELPDYEKLSSHQSIEELLSSDVLSQDATAAK